MIRSILMGTAAACLAPGAAFAQETVPDWLTGNWCTAEDGQGRTCEHWSGSPDGALLGTSETVKDGKTVSSEKMRIVIESGQAAFYASPDGAPEVRFFAMPIDEAQAVRFAAPAHDFPKYITYARDGEVLVAEISGANPAADTMRWRYTRQPD